MEKVRGLWKLLDGRDLLRGKLGLVLMGEAMFSKYLIQFSVDQWGCVPSLLFTWVPTMVEIMKIMVTSFKSSHACTAIVSVPNPAAGHHWPTPLLASPGHSQESLGQSLVGSLIVPPGSWCTQGSVCALQESVSPVLCKFFQLYGGLIGDLPQVGLCHAQVWCTQNPCPCSSPLITQTSAADTQTVLSQSLWGLWVLVHTRFLWALWASLAGMGCDSKRDFAPPTILLGLLLCPRRGVSPQSHSSATQQVIKSTWLLPSSLKEHLPWDPNHHSVRKATWRVHMDRPKW